MRFLPTTLCLALLILAPARPASAQSDAAVFASGSNKTLTLDEGSDGARSVEVVVRTHTHGVAYYYGEINAAKRVSTFEAISNTEEREEVQVPITVRLSESAVIVIADFPDTIPAVLDPSGTYEKLDPDRHLTFMRDGYNSVDKALNTRWASLKKSLPAGVMATLTKHQRAWIDHREYMSQWGAGEDYKSSPKYWESAWDMTASRLDFLDTILGKDAPPGIAGVYVDGYGGLINIIDAGEGNFRFQIHVVRGPTYHLGLITKSVAIRGGKGRFVDDDKDALWDEKPCIIDFAFDGHRLEIKAENTAYYHGARAYFDGTYFKVKGTPEFIEE